ncbi:MAG: 4-hydroxy-tetrahydrodipicolinate reductase [Candidatus Bathyarchaeia archaeon]
MRSIRICVAGATGRMGSTIIKEAEKGGFTLVGAVAHPREPSIGKSLRELGISNSDLRVLSSSNLEEAIRDAEIYVTFTNPEAEVANLPIVARRGVKIVMGTTGFNAEQMKTIEEAVKGKIPAFFSPNFSLGVNILLQILRACKLFPPDYDFSIIEFHHAGKVDAPSGTALRLADLISEVRGYKMKVYGRSGLSKRERGELEVLAVRAGGIPGIHELIVAGPYEMIRIEHTAFSRNVFAQGALRAAEWLYRQSEPRIYTMDDLLSAD